MGQECHGVEPLRMSAWEASSPLNIDNIYHAIASDYKGPQTNMPQNVGFLHGFAHVSKVDFVHPMI